MKQQDTNNENFYDSGFVFESDITTLMKMSAMDLLDLLDDFGLLEVKYISDKVLIDKKDVLKEEFNV